MSYAPSQFPPPVDSAGEFLGPPTDAEDERIEVGVAIVGGGPAGLACASRLMQLLAEDEQLLERLGEVPVALIASASLGTILLRSPTTPRSENSKMGAFASLLIATMFSEDCMPTLCWMAPEMPAARYRSGLTVLPVWPICWL